MLQPIYGIPSYRVPPQFLVTPQANFEEIDLSRLRRQPPDKYLLAKGDVLGIYIEGVLGTEEEAPPVHLPEEGSDLPPGIGFPVPVREDGTLPLPLISAIPVSGRTLAEAEAMIRQAYTGDRQILQPGRDKIIVTLIRERTVQVIVVREDGGDTNQNRQDEQRNKKMVRSSNERGRGYVVNLKAYKNDVMHALAETGGLPGLDAKNEIKILRGRLADSDRRDAFVREFYANMTIDPCFCPPPLPDDPSIVRIPLRLPPGEIPTFRPQDIILEEGDIIYIEAREADVFYTGGLLPGGEWQLPRDYDLDVVDAIAFSGRGLGAMPTGGGGGGILGGGFAGVPASDLFVMRKLPCGGQINIHIDLISAINNPRERILVKPGDTLILRYKCYEEVTNFSLVAFFTYGIRYLFTN